MELPAAGEFFFARICGLPLDLDHFVAFSKLEMELPAAGEFFARICGLPLDLDPFSSNLELKKSVQS